MKGKGYTVTEFPSGGQRILHQLHGLPPASDAPSATFTLDLHGTPESKHPFVKPDPADCRTDFPRLADCRDKRENGMKQQSRARFPAQAREPAGQSDAGRFSWFVLCAGKE